MAGIGVTTAMVGKEKELLEIIQTLFQLIQILQGERDKLSGEVSIRHERSKNG